MGGTIMSYEVVKSEKKYDGAFLSVKKDEILMPDGKTAFREVVERGAATAILPIDSMGNIILVRQYRHPFQEMILEIPAGIMEEGEEPAECEKRELEEETGFKAKELEFICEMYPTPGFCMEKLYLYIADELEQGKQHFDEDEFIEVEKYTLQQALDMVRDGKIKDAKTILLLFAYQAKKAI